MAAGAAARLGTMKRSNQVSALTLMGISPVDYLLTPLTLGFIIAMPAITLGAITLSAVASAWSAAAVSGMTMLRWSSAFFARIDLVDLEFILAKTVLSGYFVAVWTYHLAMGPKRSGTDVGESVNTSIVVGMLTVLLIHGALTVWQFA
jgi:phospholipid/cholesterol/gamma-HCH transport system permease protein